MSYRSPVSKQNHARGLVAGAGSQVRSAILGCILLSTLTGTRAANAMPVYVTGIFDGLFKLGNGDRKAETRDTLRYVSEVREEEELTNLLFESRRKKADWEKGLREACHVGSVSAEATAIACKADVASPVDAIASEAEARLPMLRREKKRSCKDGYQSEFCDDAREYQYWDPGLSETEAGDALTPSKKRILRLSYALTVSGMERLVLAARLSVLKENISAEATEKTISLLANVHQELIDSESSGGLNPVERALTRSRLLAKWGLSSIDPLDPETATRRIDYLL